MPARPERRAQASSAGKVLVRAIPFAVATANPAAARARHDVDWPPSAPCRLIRLRRSHRRVLAATALFGMLVLLGTALAFDFVAMAWAAAALLPSALLLAVPWWRQRITLAADRIDVTPTFGRTRGCSRQQVAAWATRTIDLLMPSTYLDLFVDAPGGRFVLSVPLTPLDDRDQAQLLQWAQAAVAARASQTVDAC